MGEGPLHDVLSPVPLRCPAERELAQNVDELVDRQSNERAVSNVVRVIYQTRHNKNKYFL